MLPVSWCIAQLMGGGWRRDLNARVYLDMNVKVGGALAAYLCNRAPLDNRTSYCGVCENQSEMEWVTQTN